MGLLWQRGSYLPRRSWVRIYSSNISTATAHIAGLLGVGTASPSSTLTVSGTTYTNFLQLAGSPGLDAPSSFQGGHWTASGTSVSGRSLRFPGASSL